MTNKAYFDYMAELMPFVHFRKMMGEYIVYYEDKVIGGLYDDRFLVKPTPSAQMLLPDAEYALPYEGAKEMLLVESEDYDFLYTLCSAIASELPAKKKNG